MPDRTPFDLRLEDAFARYADWMPGPADPAAVVDDLQRTGRLRRSWLPDIHPWHRHTEVFRWLLVAALLAALAAGLAYVGASRGTWDPPALTYASPDALVVARANGTQRRSLRTGEYHDPRWSPDGAWLTAWSGPVADAHLALVPVDQPGGVVVSATSAAWDPVLVGGRPVVAVVTPDGGIALTEMDGHATTITMPARATGAIDWSPDGRSIAWVAGPEIYVSEIHATGGVSSRLLTRTRRTSIRVVRVSPDGRNLAFVAADCLAECDAEVIVIGFGGGSPKSLDGVTRADTAISWDPSSQAVVVARHAQASWDLDRIATDGSGTRILASEATMAGLQSVRAHSVADGSGLLIEGTVVGVATVDLWAIRVDGGLPHPIVTGTLGGDLRTVP
jgi:Tol biopolymer transport system component